jgi:hypothetical protein
MLTPSNLIIPDEWCRKLNELQELDPEAILAGGAIRDLYCGVKVKDLDFFTTHIPSWPKQKGESDIDYEGMQYVNAVLSFNWELPLNVILINKVSNLDLLHSFDFGLCQIGFDGKSIIKTDAFLWDFKYNLMTLRHTERYPRSIRRYCRWSDRYNFDIAIPQLDTKVLLNAHPK